MRTGHSSMPIPDNADPRFWRVGWSGDEVAGAVVTTVPVEENERHGRARVYRRHGLGSAAMPAPRAGARAARRVARRGPRGGLHVRRRWASTPTARPVRPPSTSRSASVPRRRSRLPQAALSAASRIEADHRRHRHVRPGPCALSRPPRSSCGGPRTAWESSTGRAIGRYHDGQPPAEHALAGLVVEVDDPLGHPVPAELGRAGAAGVAHLVAQVGVARQRVERGRQRARVLRLDQQPLDVALHDVLEAVDVRRHDRARPAAIASSSTIPNDSWPVFGAQKMSAEAK